MFTVFHFSNWAARIVILLFLKQLSAAIHCCGIPRPTFVLLRSRVRVCCLLYPLIWLVSSPALLCTWLCACSYCSGLIRLKQLTLSCQPAGNIFHTVNMHNFVNILFAIQYYVFVLGIQFLFTYLSIILYKVHKLTWMVLASQDLQRWHCYSFLWLS